MPEDRIERELMFMKMAELVAQRSTCLRGNVGAIIVRESRVVSMGYNGAPSRAPHCIDVGCDIIDGQEDQGCQRCVHAEANALAWAARNGIATEGAEMYSTHAPCLKCAQLIVTCGINKVWYQAHYRLERLDILRQSKVYVERLTWL